MKFRIRPFEVDAVQWNKHGDHPSVRPLTETDDEFFIGMAGTLTLPLGRENYGIIEKGDELFFVHPSDWIVDGVHGLFPLSNDAINAAYERVEE